jgi:hypothetical protein
VNGAYFRGIFEAARALEVPRHVVTYRLKKQTGDYGTYTYVNRSSNKNGVHYES